MTLSLLVSILSGGLAGGIVSNVCNRVFHWRDLRGKFYPVLKNMYSAYFLLIQETPHGRGQEAEFVDKRATFIDNLVAFNELKEARRLRQAIIDNSFTAVDAEGFVSKRSLQTEFIALQECMEVLHKKLQLDPPRERLRRFWISNRKRIREKLTGVTPHVDGGE